MKERKIIAEVEVYDDVDENDVVKVEIGSSSNVKDADSLYGYVEDYLYDTFHNREFVRKTDFDIYNLNEVLVELKRKSLDKNL